LKGWDVKNPHPESKLLSQQKSAIPIVPLLAQPQNTLKLAAGIKVLTCQEDWNKCISVKTAWLSDHIYVYAKRRVRRGLVE
jgi:hypothetical protein